MYKQYSMLTKKKKKVEERKRECFSIYARA